MSNLSIVLSIELKLGYDVMCVFVCTEEMGFWKVGIFSRLFSTRAHKGSRRTKAFSSLCFLTDIQWVLHVREEMRSKDEYNTIPPLRELMFSKDLK